MNRNKARHAPNIAEGRRWRLIPASISLEQSSVCIGGAIGSVVQEGGYEPDALIGQLLSRACRCPRKPDRYRRGCMRAGLVRSDVAGELLKTRHVLDGVESMPIKTDKEDMQDIARLMRLN